MKPKENLLILACPEQDANLYYATRFIAPDQFAFFEIRGRKILLMSDLEVDRARKEACVHEVVSLSRLAKEYTAKHNEKPSYAELLAYFSKLRKVKKFIVPENFPLRFADLLRKKGLTLETRQDPFFPERTIKTREEIAAIQKTLRFTEAAVAAAIQVMKTSTVKHGRLFSHGKPVTSESLKKLIDVKLMEQGCTASRSIVACGRHGVDPHDEGSGPIFANQPVIFDVFPRDSHSRYFADLSRTVVKGKALPKLRRMFLAVKEAQTYAFKHIRAGIDASEIHKNIQLRFESLGFKTGVQNGRVQGFFHSTGHGVGLDIHESPRISRVKDILQAGQVVTVEPGLYYEDTGGVRLEDMILVTRTGCKNLTRLPKVLEI